jgi:hypothetical protein
MRLAGIEPARMAPEAIALSIRLQARLKEYARLNQAFDIYPTAPQITIYLEAKHS